MTPRPDLLFSGETRDEVRAAYAAVTSTRGVVAERLYSPDELARVPAGAAEFMDG